VVVSAIAAIARQLFNIEFPPLCEVAASANYDAVRNKTLLNEASSS
jgi:hypothetical protein